jgi:hypothetical protein
MAKTYLKNANLICIYLLIWLAFTSSNSMAKTIKLTGQTIIDKTTEYKNINFDLSRGFFIITNNATLTIENSTINGSISPVNSSLIKLSSGHLVLKNNIINVDTINLPPTPGQPSKYNVINIVNGDVKIIGNNFSIKKQHMASLLVTNQYPTTGFSILNNKIHNFNGGFFLSYSNNAIVAGNEFSNVSTTNIFTLHGKDNLFKNNVMLFSGDGYPGNGIDVIDSDHITLSHNYIASGSCYSLFILRSQNIVIDDNSIVSGITHAIYIAPTIGLNDGFQRQLLPFINQASDNNDKYKNRNITIKNNYFAQNRFGIAATNVDGLRVENNIFIQRFSDKKSRLFWTNNDNLLLDNINLIWSNNVYKEAFSQTIPGDNNEQMTLQFHSFPSRGGVYL